MNLKPNPSAQSLFIDLSQAEVVHWVGGDVAGQGTCRPGSKESSVQ